MKEAGHKAAANWRKRVDGYRLFFDEAREALMDLSSRHGGARTPAEALDFIERLYREHGPGGRLSKLAHGALPPHLSLMDGLVDLVRRANAAAVGSPLGRPADDTVRLVREWCACASAFLSGYAVLSPKTKLFVVDGRLAADVVASVNVPLEGEDLGHLPYPQTWVEFDAPVPVADGFTKRLEVAAALLAAHPSGLRFVTLLVPRGSTAALHEGITFVFWGDRQVAYDFPRDILDSLGLGGELPESVRGQVLSASRNLYDFLTSRSFDYVAEKRPEKDYSQFRRFKHLQGGAFKGVRDYRRVRVNKEVIERHGPGRPCPEAVGTLVSVEVPGCFHRWVYCRACGDLHRHDLIGLPCRKCGLTVGPTANLRVERYWHPPHVRGKGVLRDYVRHLIE